MVQGEHTCYTKRNRFLPDERPTLVLQHLDWDDVLRRRLRPPILPSVAHDGDVKNYDDYPEIDWARVPRATERERSLFEDF